MKRPILLSLAGVAAGGLFALGATQVAVLADDDEAEQAVELGAVDWLRDYDTAAQQAADQGKPIFLLFQEVPG